MTIDELYAARRAVFEELLGRFEGGKAALAALIGVSPTYIPRMLKGPADPASKPIGDQLALRIEERCDLEPGTMLFPGPVRPEHQRRPKVVVVQQQAPIGLPFERLATLPAAKLAKVRKMILAEIEEWEEESRLGHARKRRHGS